MNKEIEIPEGYEAEIKDGKIIIREKESEDERIRREMIYWLKGFIGEEEGCGSTDGEIRERIAYLERQKAKEDYDRMAPIYKDKESFESALEKAWKFYNDIGSFAADGCEDNAIERAFAKGFREGFLCGEAQDILVDKLDPSWDEERQAVYIPIINKYLDAKHSEKEMRWFEAVEYAAESDKGLPGIHETFAILSYKDKINVILQEHGGDILNEVVWISASIASFLCVDFYDNGIGCVPSSDFCYVRLIAR